MKILQVHNEYRIDGGENIVLDRDAAELVAAGHEVVRYAATNEGGGADTLVALALAPWNPVQSRRLVDVIERESPDVMHVHNTWFKLTPAVIAGASRAGIPIVQTLHNYRWLCVNGEMIRDGAVCRDCVTTSRFAAVRHKCYRSSTPLSIVAAATGAVAERRGVWTDAIDRFIVLTPTAKESFSRWGFPDDRLVIRPHRIDDPGPREAPPSSSDTVVFVGRIGGNKGVRRLCEAWVARDRRLRLAIVGDGPLADELSGAYPSVDFVGRVEPRDVLRLMQQSRALVLPTESEEAFPLVVVEAMAAAMPVALSSIAVVKDYVAGISPELVFDIASRDDWERIFARLDDDETVDIDGVRARAMYEATFAPDNAGSLIAVYEAAIAHRQNRA